MLIGTGDSLAAAHSVVQRGGSRTGVDTPPWIFYAATQQCCGAQNQCIMQGIGCERLVRKRMATDQCASTSWSTKDILTECPLVRFGAT
jgi:hypothetical protein